MSKGKNKKQKPPQEKPMKNANERADDTTSETASQAAEEKKREIKNENMFRLWNARPTQVPSAHKAKDAAEPLGLRKHAIDWKSVAIAATIVCVLAIFSHIMGLFGQFVLNDQLILTPLKIGGDSELFWSTLVARGLATPLSGLWTNISLAMDLKSGSLVWFHLVNLSLHAIASVYLFFLLFQLGRYWLLERRTDVRPEYFAFAAAGLFACHPLVSEVISYIPGREMALVGTNYFLAMFLFFSAFVARRPVTMILLYAAMFVCVVMAALSGPASVTIPLALLCVAALAKPPEMEWKEFAQLRWPDLTIIGMLAAAFIYLISRGIPTALNNGVGLITLPFDQYLASQFKAFVTYFLRCFLVPGGLSIEPPLVVAKGFIDPLALLGVAAVGAITYLAYRYRAIPQVVFGLVLTLIGLLPDFVLPQSEIVSDARFYISIAGLSIVFGWGVAKMSALNFKQVAAAVTILFVGFAGLSNWRALAWSTDENVWREILRTNPQSARAHAKLGFLALIANKVPDAQKEADEAIKLDAQLPLAHLLLGRIRQSEHNSAEAYKEFETALKLAKDNNASAIIVAQCQAQLADALVRQGDYARVKDLVKEAKVILGESAQLHYLTGMLALNDKQFVNAIVELQQGFIQDPKNEQYVEPLVTAYLGSRMPTLIPQAYKLIDRAIATFPTREAFLLQARAAIELNRITEAKEAIDNAVKMGEEDAQTFYLRSFVARAEKNDAQATAFKAKALALDPKIESNVPVIAPEQMKKYLDKEVGKPQTPQAPTTIPTLVPRAPSALSTPNQTTPTAPATTQGSSSAPATGAPAPSATEVPAKPATNPAPAQPAPAAKPAPAAQPGLAPPAAKP